MSESCSVVSDSLWPRGLYSPWIFQARILEWVAFPSPGDPSPGPTPGPPALQAVFPSLAEGSPCWWCWVSVAGRRLSVWCTGFSRFDAGEACCPVACGILVPWPGIRLVCPVLEGRFSMTGPPGKLREFGFRQTRSPVMWLCWLICKMEITSQVYFKVVKT